MLQTENSTAGSIVAHHQFTRHSCGTVAPHFVDQILTLWYDLLYDKQTRTLAGWNEG
jgi:hypothetical protein